MSASHGREVDEKREQVDALADEIALAAAHIDAATHDLLKAIRAFDACKGWAWQGAKSCAHWLSWRIGLARGAAREKVRVARALGELPRIDAAMAAGRLSYSKVRAMTRVATAENEELLLVFATSSTGAQLETICRGYRQVARLEGGVAHPDERFVRRRALPSGMVRIEAQLHPDEAELVLLALREARHALRDESRARTDDAANREDEATAAGTISAATISAGKVSAGKVSAGKVIDEPDEADALVAVAESFLAGGVRARSGGERNQLFIHLREALLSPPGDEDHEQPSGGRRDEPEPFLPVLHDGSHLSGDTFRRLACDAGLVIAKVDASGIPLDVGRKMRTVSPALRRALTLRDGGCRFPGCGQRTFVDAHHIHHWCEGGATSLDNTLLLCGRHHRAVHEEGFRVTREGSSVVFRDPDGNEILAAPPPPRLRGNAIAILAARHAKRDITRRTNLPAYTGDPLDLHAAVGALVRKTLRPPPARPSG